MFRDFKEYQEIYNLYQNSVYLSEEQRQFVKAIDEAELTDEELYYFSENTDEVIDHLIETEVLDEGKAKAIKGVFKLGGLVKGLSKTKLPTKGYNLSNIGGFKGFKGAPLKGISSKLTNPFKNLKTPKLKGKKDISKTVKGVKDGVKKNLAKAQKTPLKSIATAGGVGAIIGGGLTAAKKSGENKAQINATQAELAAIKKQLEKIQKERDDKIDKDVDKYVKDRKNPGGINKDLTIDKSKEKETEVKPETKTETKPETKTETKPETKTEVKPETKTETKPKKMHPIEKKNRARFGDAHVDKLKAKQVDFKAMKKGKMSKADFIKKYPKSITAQKAAGLRDHAEWDAYDMVLEYLFSTEQVASLEEANYVMMEMDQQTIGSIVNEVSEFLEEGIGSVRILPALGKMALGAAAVKGISSYLGKKSGESSIKGSQPMKGREKGGDLLKQGINAIKKAKENPGTGINPNTREALKIMNNNGY